MISPPRRSRTAAAVSVVVALTVCGAALGALWAWIAPSVHTLTALTRSGERVDAFLGTEADNLFVAAAMMIGLLCMLAIVAAVAVWQWRDHPGPWGIGCRRPLRRVCRQSDRNRVQVARQRRLLRFPPMCPDCE